MPRYTKRQKMKKNANENETEMAKQTIEFWMCSPLFIKGKSEKKTCEQGKGAHEYDGRKRTDMQFCVAHIFKHYEAVQLRWPYLWSGSLDFGLIWTRS